MIAGIVSSVVGGALLTGILWLLREKLSQGVRGALVALFAAGVLLWFATEAGSLRWGEREDRAGEQLSVLVFNATRTQPVQSRYGGPAIDEDFYWTVNEMKRVLNDCSIDAREYWHGRRVRQRTQLFYNGARARGAADEIELLLPGNQDVGSLESSDLWGIHDDRDVVMLLGRDAWYIRERLRSVEENWPCPRLVAQQLETDSTNPAGTP